MDHQATPSGSATISGISFLLSIGSFLIAETTMNGIAWAIGIGSGLVAITSGVMAIRYYHFATKNIRKK